MHQKYILSDKGIKQLISNKYLVIKSEISEDQIQPCTIDLRIKNVRVYDKNSILANQIQ